MCRYFAASLAALILTVAAPTPARSQDSLPSKEEISELTSKADQKVSALEEAVNAAKPSLDKLDPRLAINYLNAAAAAHTLIEGVQKNGPSAYGLVGLLATLDDLSLDAANGSLQLVGLYAATIAKGTPADGGAILAIMTRLSNSGAACNDIAELIFHATLRTIKAEEDILHNLLANQK